MKLSKITTEELLAELAYREHQFKTTEDELVIPWIFMYGFESNEFETKLIPIRQPKDLDVTGSLELRARFNGHRKIEMFSVMMTDKEADTFNQVIFENDEPEFADFSKYQLAKFSTRL